jgi:tRNA-uridine 2-sulfurtransferase
MKNETVVVAMSGGVDSSIAAALLHNEGYRVIGMTMKLWDYEEVGGNIGHDSACCTIDSTNDARSVCDTLGVPHYTVDLRNEFEESVIADFVKEYGAGRTPNPCVRCNAKIKWAVLFERAQALGAKYMATGHYARIVRRSDGGTELRAGLDREKDQSYALWGVSQEMLHATLLPLGDMTKDQTRRLAADLNLKTADKPESQDICFVPDGDYGRFLSEREERSGVQLPALESGDIRTTSGEIVGQHEGTARYTIGQRKGLGIAVGRPQFVTRIDAGTKTIWVGDIADLLSSTLVARESNWILGDPPDSGTRIMAKIRYRAAASPCSIEVLEDGFRLSFDEPQRAITPGQSVTLYDGELVLGGGVIESAG